jgi:hypothetical protein
MGPAVRPKVRNGEATRGSVKVISRWFGSIHAPDSTPIFK